MKRTSCIIVLLTVAFLTSCKKEEIAVKQTSALDFYTESYNTPGAGIQPPLRVEYEYGASGKLSRYTVFGYNSATSAYEAQRYLTFNYASSRVDKIEGYLTGSSTPYVQDTYQYLLDGRVSKISENNYAAALTSEANFLYGTTDESIKVNYTYSNGAGFDYEFSYADHNIQNDKTTRGTELCNTGVYTYDKKSNPFNALGYVDYELVNLSVNNKLVEDVNYISCSFPALVPATRIYEYNDQGYPTVLTTTFKNSQLKSERRFYYK